jgi:hypothetical protein
MPEYLFRDNNTKKEWLEWMGISAADKYLEENPHIERLVNGCPGIHSGRGLGGGLKIDNGFNDVLKEIKKKHNGGYRLGRSTINTK